MMLNDLGGIYVCVYIYIIIYMIWGYFSKKSVYIYICYIFLCVCIYNYTNIGVI